VSKLGAAVLILVGATGFAVQAKPAFRPNEIIVKFDPNVAGIQSAQIAEAYGCRLAGTCPAGHLQLVRVPEPVDPQQMAAAFEQRADVVYAEPNPIATILYMPDDSYYSYQWNLQNSDTGGIHMEDAWDSGPGDPNVIVAILDTGVAYEDYGIYRQAPDLADTLFVAGYDFVNDDDHPNDDQGHGTHVAGTIGQSTNNGMGVAGIAYGCSIMPVKVLDRDGLGDHFTIAKGIRFAAENGARVINMSLGSPSASKTLREAVAFAYGRGVTIVCASGNSYRSGNPKEYPAGYDDYCIAVGAVRYDNQRAPYSGTGAHVDLVAPGGDMRVDQNGDGYVDGIVQQTFVDDPTDFAYYFFQGTSMAAPHVSGLAALLISQGITEPDDVRTLMQDTAVDLGPVGWDEEYGWGCIDAGAALRQAGILAAAK
jgi:serine protease